MRNSSNVHLERVQHAKDEAQRAGRELLTPIAARKLFGKSPEAVRQAVRNGCIEAEFDLWVTDKNVSMIRLDSAISYWGQPPGPELQRMRDNCVTIADRSVIYNLLSPRPLLSPRDRGEVE